MHLRTLIVTLSILAIAATAADAAAKRKTKDLPPPSAVVVPAPESKPVSPSYYECWTDEGYGRRLPCDFGGK